MIGRVIEIAEPGRLLRLERGLMVVVDSKDGDELGRIALDQIGAVLCTARGVTASSSLILALSERAVPLVYCGAGFLPSAILWPVDAHHVQSARIEAQATASIPLVKRLWQQIVKAKIANQSLVLDHLGKAEGAAALQAISKRVRSGDAGNLEAQAARRYWPLVFDERFRRDQNAGDVNALLNYAYAILRSATARAVMANGLHPSIGLHHSNRYNAMRLVDDLMEPYRPLFDLGVRRLYRAGHVELTRPARAYLASLFVGDVRTELGTTPLMTVLNRLAYSLVLALDGAPRARLDLPPIIERGAPLLALAEPPASGSSA